VEPAVPPAAGQIFCEARHGYVWDAIHACWERGEAVDSLNVYAEIERRGLARETGGRPYLHTLEASVPTGALTDPAPYLGRILGAWEKRGSDASLVRGRQVIAAPDGGDAGAILDAVIAEIETARARRTRGRTAVQVGSLIGDVLTGLRPEPWDEDAAGIAWPYVDLGGERGPMNPMMPGQMIGIAGRPGAGKTTVLKDACEHCSFHQGWPSLLLSYESKARDITARVLSSQAHILLSHLTRPGLINDADLARVEDFRRAMEAAQMFVVDSEDTSIAELDRLIRQYRPRLVAIDYLQLAVPDGPDSERRHRVERYSRAVKILAGRIGEVDAIVAKQRNGPTDTVTLANRLHYAAFADMAQ
jgi:replicative DNA helicase